MTPFIRSLFVITLAFTVSGSMPTSADNLLSPPAFVLTHQVSQATLPQPGNPFGIRVGLEDYFNQGGQFANIYEHGFVGDGGSRPSRAYLAPCVDPTDTPCIESVSSRSVGASSWELGSVSAVQPIYRYGVPCLACEGGALYEPFLPIPYDKSLQYGGNPSMWSLPQAPHGGGSDYRVDVQLNQRSGSSCGYDPCTFIQIVPLELGPSLSLDTINIPTSPVGRGLDYHQFEFPKNIEFRVVIRLAGANLLKPDGFFFGRITNLKIESSDDEMKHLAISGTPVRVPFAQVYGIPMDSIPSALRDDLDPNLKSNVICRVADLEACVLQFASASNNPVMRDFTAWENLGLKALASGTIWEIRAANPPSAQNCTKLFVGNGLTGSVSTNSTLYSADVPTWDPLTQSFTYTVASTHLDEQGVPNRGFYQLALRSDVVACLWGKDASASSARVQIVSEDGTAQVATTDVHVQDGTFYFTAANFEYSNPKLRVSFLKPVITPVAPTQVVKGLPTPSASPLASSIHGPKPKSKISITCVKGKVIKKIINTKPICPSGYKKK